MLLALILWSLLVTAGVHGNFRELFHPQVFSRALASSIFLVVLAGWRLRVVYRSSATDTGSFRALIPLFLLLVLVPPAIRPTQPDYSRLNLTPGGRVLSASVPTRPLQQQSRQQPVQTDLLAAVDDLLASTPEPVPDTPRANSEGLEELLERSDPIVITDEEYARIIDMIWESPERLAGRTVEVVSFVFRRPEWPDDVFTAARRSIWCCVVDAAVIGLLVDPGTHRRPREGEWIRIRGELAVRDTFETGTITMNRVPFLHNIAWEPVAAPSFEYVFPAEW